jgi:rod shape-determining protein MreD
MIMPRGQQLLLPANPTFMLVTLLIALLLDMVQSMALFGNAAWTLIGSLCCWCFGVCINH